MMVPDRPFAHLPRWAAALLLVILAALCAWNAAALADRNRAHTADVEERLAEGQRVDMDLYRQVRSEVAAGEDYYTAATAGNREFGFPTRPFVTVRTPIMAWVGAAIGAQGWRVVAASLLAANIFAWFIAMNGKVSRFERDAATVLAALFGALAFIPEIAYSHEGIAGLLVSLAIPLSVTRGWSIGLIAAALGVATRELAYPFLFAWAFVLVLEQRYRRFAAVFAAILVAALGLWLHALAVDAARLPDDATSPGWMGMFGPALPLYGIHLTTLLQTLPLWLAGPLGILALFGWIAVGGRLGTLATVWFTGFMAAVAIFARQENFYWMGLFVPAYGVGLAFAPRALGELAGALVKVRGHQSTT